MDQFNLYTVVPRDCVDWTKYVSGRWEEQERGDEIRSRWVLRQFKRGDPRDDVFAVASTGATSKIIDYIGVSRGLVFFTADAKNAFWHVPIDEDCYTDAPGEWTERNAHKYDELVMWKLNREWYGRRATGTRWVNWLADVLVELGFERCSVAP